MTAPLPLRLDRYAGLVIDGETSAGSAGGGTILDRDPATGEVIAEVAAAAAADVQRAIDAARRAQRGWARLAPGRRGALLLELARRIRDCAGDLSRVESVDTGKPLAQARADVEVAAQYFEFYGGYADKLYGETIPLGEDDFGMTFREPVGVTGHIIPWNYPIQIGSRTIAPSLMAGNTCVVKPAEEAPLSAVALGVLALEAGLPAGVLNVVPGDGELAGAFLSASDGIDHLSFTGGLATGRLVMGAAARNVKPVTLELGGKSASIVLDDADLDRAAEVLTRAIVQNAGQTCSAGSRIIAQAAIHDELVARLEHAFSRISIGHGLADPDMGPLISAVQRRRVLDYLGIAEGEGGVLLSGGGDDPRLRGYEAGHFVAPALVTGVAPAMRVAREEIFGPVLCVLRAADDAEALRIAEDSPFGLVASVWSANVDRALGLARNLRVGQAYVNSYGAAGNVTLPFGGTRHSGFGREKGLEAVREYTQVKTIAVHVSPR
ncbi:MAG TPA: aldehyde dehydrogenase family protein [Candidatus Dormibacteraeota bacterium]|jgi:acyl-CoA reductase-like NAD-dependent aldehyde dehydrogenase